jgi:hypothetical protein
MVFMVSAEGGIPTVGSPKITVITQRHPRCENQPGSERTFYEPGRKDRAVAGGDPGASEPAKSNQIKADKGRSSRMKRKYIFPRGSRSRRTASAMP